MVMYVMALGFLAAAAPAETVCRVDGILGFTLMPFY
jgi:hypothetical protein